MSKAAHHERVTSNLSQKSILTVKVASGSPSRTEVADSSPTGTRIVDESGRLREYQGDGFSTDPVSSNYAHGARDRAAQAGPIIRLCARLILLIAANLAIFFVWTCPSAERARGSSRFTGRLVQGIGHCGTVGYSSDKYRTNGVEPSGMGVAYHGERSVFCRMLELGRTCGYLIGPRCRSSRKALERCNDRRRSSGRVERYCVGAPQRYSFKHALITAALSGTRDLPSVGAAAGRRRQHLYRCSRAARI
jgi:hypothetical protein